MQLLGFAGSALIIASLTMQSVVRLRWIGLAGAAVFVTYGLLLGAWPIVLMNTVTSCIHIHRLRTLNAEPAGTHAVPGTGLVPTTPTNA